jgi:hypothetical protein
MHRRTNLFLLSLNTTHDPYHILLPRRYMDNTTSLRAVVSFSRRDGLPVVLYERAACAWLSLIRARCLQAARRKGPGVEWSLSKHHSQCGIISSQAYQSLQSLIERTSKRSDGYSGERGRLPASWRCLSVGEDVHHGFLARAIRSDLQIYLEIRSSVAETDRTLWLDEFSFDSRSRVPPGGTQSRTCSSMQRLPADAPGRYRGPLRVSEMEALRRKNRCGIQACNSNDSMSTVMPRDKDGTYVKAWRHHDLIGNMAQSPRAHDSQLHPPPRREAF